MKSPSGLTAHGARHWPAAAWCHDGIASGHTLLSLRSLVCTGRPESHSNRPISGHSGLSRSLWALRVGARAKGACARRVRGTWLAPEASVGASRSTPAVRPGPGSSLDPGTGSGSGRDPTWLEARSPATSQPRRAGGVPQSRAVGSRGSGLGASKSAWARVLTVLYPMAAVHRGSHDTDGCPGPERLRAAAGRAGVAWKPRRR